MPKFNKTTTRCAEDSESNMAFTHSPKIVTDGLVLYIDPANTKSYPSGSSVCVDLIDSSYSGSLNLTTWTADKLGVFNFTNTAKIDFTDTTGKTDFTTANDYSISCWTKISSTQNYTTYTVKPIFDKGGRIGDTLNIHPYSMLYVSGSNSIRSSVATTTAVEYIDSVTPIVLDTWQYLTSVYSWSTQKLTVYVNTIPTELTLTITGTIANTSILAMMEGAGMTNGTNGSLGPMWIYNRALSLQEVLQNFEATRGRYGI